MMAAPGNHETYDDKELANYRAYLGLPENGPEGMRKQPIPSRPTMLCSWY